MATVGNSQARFEGCGEHLATPAVPLHIGLSRSSESGRPLLLGTDSPDIIRVNGPRAASGANHLRGEM